jgi:hypothetical protein
MTSIKIMRSSCSSYLDNQRRDKMRMMMTKKITYQDIRGMLRNTENIFKSHRGIN